MKPVAIIDIDTTIANNDHRAVLLKRNCIGCKMPMGGEHRPVCSNCGGTKHHTPQEHWDQFLQPALMLQDVPQPHALRAIQSLREARWKIIFMTGRGERLRMVTEEWLLTHMGRRLSGLDHEPVIMRPASDKGTPASQMKEQMFLNTRATYRLDGPFFFFEDDKYVHGMFQKYGTVFMCPHAWEHINPAGHDRTEEPAWNR